MRCPGLFQFPLAPLTLLLLLVHGVLDHLAGVLADLHNGLVRQSRLVQVLEHGDCYVLYCLLIDLV